MHQYLQPSTLDKLVEFKDFQTGQQIKPFNISEAFSKEAKVAILTVPNELQDTSFQGFRSEWYKLAANFTHPQVWDLGNVRGGLFGLIEVVHYLLKHQVYPIIVAENPLAIEAQLKAYEQLNTSLNVAVVDSHLDYAWNEPEAPYLLNRLLPKHPEDLFHLTWLGHQVYFVDTWVAELLREKHFTLYRLGQLRANIEETEPLVRDADIFGFNLSAIRAADMPENLVQNPSGLWTEEACRVVRYAALSDNNSSLCLCGFQDITNAKNLTAKLLAQLVWFAIDGFFNRKKDYPLQIEQLQKYIVGIKNLDFPIAFFKSPRSERWWFALPNLDTNAYPEKHQFVSCSYKDYQKACEGELPERLFDAIERLG